MRRKIVPTQPSTAILVLLSTTILCCASQSAPKVGVAPRNSINVAENFVSLVKVGRYEDAAMLLDDTFIVRLTAYEIDGGGCIRHYQDKKHIPSENISNHLKRLSNALDGSAQYFDDGSYGVAGIADCEHVWSVRADSANNRITQITLDAEDNAWHAGTVKFNLTD